MDKAVRRMAVECFEGKEMNHFFSIIVPVYNVAPYLRECLDSVLAQTFPDWEAICVDDGSTDGSGTILDEYKAKDVRVHVVHQKNTGVGATRNTALDVAQGEWLVFLDGDDLLMRDSLARYAELIGNYPHDAFFIIRPHRFGSKELPMQECHGDGQIVFETTNGGKMLGIENRLPGFPFVRLLRRAIFGDMRFPVGVPMMEDYLTLFDNLEKKAHFAQVNLIAYNYREREGGASRAYPVGRILCIFKIYEDVYRIIRERLGLDEAKAAWYFCQDRTALQFYFYEGTRSESVENQVLIATILLKLNKKCHGKLLSPFVFLRCKILTRFRRPLGFAILKCYECLWRGISARMKRLIMSHV